MQRLIKVLSPDEKIGMTVFYANQEVIHKPSANAALVSQGQDYYGKIFWRCHGEQRRGNESFARVAGHQPD